MKAEGFIALSLLIINTQFILMKMNKTIIATLLALIMVSCGTDSSHFEIDGRLLNLNQGEFYVYSPDGNLNGIDTIKVQAGRFTYKVECQKEMTLMIVFPNFTEQPVFAAPGKSVDIKGDASHLKEMKVKGTKANELMNLLREQIANASPTEIQKYARQFVEDHPESIVSTYVVRNFFLQKDNPDFATAKQLLELMLKTQPENNSLKATLQTINNRTKLSKNSGIPKFATYDINGKAVNNTMLSGAGTTVVQAWASWNYNSISMLQSLASLQNNTSNNIKVVGVCLDYSRSECRRVLQSRGIENVITICDGKSIDGYVYNLLGMSNLPDNIIIENGKVTDTNLTFEQLNKKLRK